MIISPRAERDRIFFPPHDYFGFVFAWWTRVPINYATREKLHWPIIGTSGANILVRTLGDEKNSNKPQLDRLSNMFCLVLQLLMVCLFVPGLPTRDVSRSRWHDWQSGQEQLVNTLPNPKSFRDCRFLLVSLVSLPVVPTSPHMRTNVIGIESGSRSGAHVSDW